MNQSDNIQMIQKAFDSVSMTISNDMLEKFGHYQKLLLEWNQNINLISRQDEHRIITRHFLESAGLCTAFEFYSSVPIIDIGTGAGFPGLPIKIIRPELEMVLVESRKKKALFLEEVIEFLNLKNVSVHPVRVEDMAPLSKKVICISRAVATMDQLFKWSRSLLLEKGGQLVAMKGPNLTNEIQVFQKRYPETSIEAIPYNPFPKVYPLKDHYLGEIRL